MSTMKHSIQKPRIHVKIWKGISKSIHVNNDVKLILAVLYGDDSLLFVHTQSNSVIGHFEEWVYDEVGLQ